MAYSRKYLKGSSIHLVVVRLSNIFTTKNTVVRGIQYVGDNLSVSVKISSFGSSRAKMICLLSNGVLMLCLKIAGQVMRQQLLLLINSYIALGYTASYLDQL